MNKKGLGISKGAERRCYDIVETCNIKSKEILDYHQYHKRVVFIAFYQPIFSPNFPRPKYSFSFKFNPN